MKPVRRTVLVLVSLLIVAGVIGYLAIDGGGQFIARRPEQTKLETSHGPIIRRRWHTLLLRAGSTGLPMAHRKR